jgi:transposase
VRIVGQAPLAATVYELERLRCNACGQVFTAEEPEDVGPEKYDETASAMIAQLKYGSGIPFYRLESLEGQLGIPLPAATQWEIVEEAAEAIKPAHEELIRQAAQGEVLHNDDTGMRVLRMERETSDERTGVFTSGIVSTGQGRHIALYFTGRQHAGENMADVLAQRAAELPCPIQMCDALSRNVPKLGSGVEILLANCIAHGRRQFVEVADIHVSLLSRGNATLPRRASEERAKTIIPGIRSSHLCLSAVVPALRRTGHPFAVSGLSTFTED